MNAKNAGKKVVCKGCGCEVTPMYIREPSVFSRGIQISGKLYKACPECLLDLYSGDDRQVVDVEKIREKQAGVDIKAIYQDARETVYAVFYAVCIIVALIVIVKVAFCAIDMYDNLIYWFKGTKLGFWYYTNNAK